MVTQNRVNMTIGYFASTSIRRSHMSSSYVYFASNLIWMVPPGAEIPSLEKLLKPFDAVLWICFLVVLLGAIVAVGALKSGPKKLRDFVIGSNIHDPTLNIFNIWFGGSMNQLPSTNFARYVLMVFMIYCFVVTNSYKGGLLNFVRKTVRESQLATTDEMISKGFTFYMLESSKAYLTEMPYIRERAVFVSAEGYTKALDHMIDSNFKGAILTSKDHLAYRNIQSYPNRYYNHAPEVIFGNNLVIYLNKNSCLTSRIDSYIVRLVSAGLIDIWAAKYIDKSFLKRKFSDEAKALKYSQLIGAFQLLFVGLAVSLAAFLVENFHRFYGNKTSRRRVFYH